MSLPDAMLWDAPWDDAGRDVLGQQCDALAEEERNHRPVYGCPNKGCFTHGCERCAGSGSLTFDQGTPDERCRADLAARAAFVARKAGR